MSTPRKFLVCDSLVHAAVADEMACAFFVDTDGNKGSAWSGVFSKPGLLSDTYAIAWEPQLAAFFGEPLNDPSMSIEDEVIDQNGESNWQDLPAAEVEPEE